jgi:condensation domain-containing protein
MLPSDIRAKLQGLSPEKRALLEQKLARSKPSIPKRGPKDPRVLSFAQQQLWLIDQMSPGSAAYNVPYPVRIKGPLRPELLEQSVNQVVARHEVLRTVFLNHNGTPIAVLPKQWRVELVRVDLRSVPETERETELWRLLRLDGARAFDLARDMKLRTTLFQTGDEEFIFHHVSHHISWDMVSKAIFYREVGQIYDALCRGVAPSLPELPAQYFDFALWQRNTLHEKRFAELTSFWQQTMSGMPPHLELPPDKERPPVQSMRGRKHMIEMPADLLEAVRLRSADLNVTSYMILLATYKVLLLCYSRQEDIVVGSPFAARPPGAEGMIGMFVNTLVLRTKIALDLTFREVVYRVRDTTLAAIAHQDCPFQKIVEAVRPPRDPSRNALFQVNFRVQGGSPAPLELRDVTTELLRPADNGFSKFDLALELPSSPKSMGFFEYSTDLFDASTIEKLSDNFFALLRTLLADPLCRLADIPLVREICRTCRRPAPASQASAD